MAENRYSHYSYNSLYCCALQVVILDQQCQQSQLFKADRMAIATSLFQVSDYLVLNLEYVLNVTLTTSVSLQDNEGSDIR